MRAIRIADTEFLLKNAASEMNIFTQRNEDC